MVIAMLDILSALVDWVVSGISAVIDLLPDSPFSGVLLSGTIGDYMGQVNYFVPIGMMVNTLAAWTGCIIFWYAASLFMRWLKAIE